MSLEDSIRVFSNLYASNHLMRVNLTGGEPLLRPDLANLVTAARDRQLYVAICSNGTLLTEKLADFLAGKIVYFEMGLDYSGDEQLGSTKYSKSILKAIEILNVREIPVTLTAFVACEEREETLRKAEYIMTEAANLGVSTIKFRTPKLKGRGKLLPDRFFDKSLLPAIYEHLKAIKSEREIKIRIRFNDWTITKKEGSTILLLPDGTLVGTPYSEDPSHNIVIGNVLKNSVEELWARYPFVENHIARYTDESRITLE